MTFASFQLLIAHGRIRSDREYQIVDWCFASPVIRVCFIADQRIFLITNQLEWAGANRVLIECILIVHHLLCVFSRVNGSKIHRKVCDHWSLWTGQNELHSVVVYLHDLFDEIRHGHCVEVFVVTAGNAEVWVFFVALTVEGEDHVVRVEITRWSEVFGGVEFYALTQLEGVFLTIFRYVPAFSQCWSNACCTALKFNQLVEDLAGRRIKCCACCVERWCEALRRTF